MLQNPYIYTDNMGLRYLDWVHCEQSLSLPPTKQKESHFIMAKSLNVLLLGFFAVCPERTAWIFLFLVSVFLSCFLIFFLAAMSGLTTAWQGLKKK